MEDFKRIIKMKTGGSVSKAIAAYEKRERKSEEKADIAQDKKIVKKAIAMHDKQEHKGEKTDLSKLRKGGRAKKEAGTVRKFEKASGQYGAKKTAEDKKNIAEAKRFKKGGKVKKYSGEDGSYVTKAVDAVKSFGSDLKDKILGTEEQNRKAQESLDLQASKGSKLAKFFGGKADAESAPVKKCGGGRMRKKYATGGSIDDDVRARAMKWIESGSPEQAEAPVKPSKPKAAAKSQPESDREEYSPWMRELRKKEATEAENKRESESLAAKYPEKRTPSKMIRDEAEIAQRPSLETKGARLLKSVGMRRGGKACK